MQLSKRVSIMDEWRIMEMNKSFLEFAWQKGREELLKYLDQAHSAGALANN